MRDLVAGMTYLAQGQRWVGRNRRQWGFGLLPGLITLVGYATAAVVLAFWADDFVAWATPFADDWGSPWVGLFRGALMTVFFGAVLMLSTITFTAVTLLVGQPFYEALSERVDLAEGGSAAESGLPLWRELWISARESLAVLVRVAVWGVLLFALGFVPVIGQTVIPVLGFLVSGFFLAEELTAVALQRRGVPLRERLRLLRSRKLLTLGFGVPLALLFLVPFVAVFVMPGAVAGATLLVRNLMGEETPEPAGEPEQGVPQPPAHW
ncbi:EI24 domain-containing protein [Streptomyces sp. C36]|uniref:EI24 domain-containing protein n=1 Tax=Streptomyces sp. C36 TaxID=3237122 RepID=UPI0034C5C6B8